METFTYTLLALTHITPPHNKIKKMSMFKNCLTELYLFIIIYVKALAERKEKLG